MRKTVSLALAYIILFSSSALADINCGGDVTVVMDYPTYCNGNTAFRTSASNGKWICSTSNNGNAILLTALAAGKHVSVYMDSENGTLTCSTLPDYKNARYIIMF